MLTQDVIKHFNGPKKIADALTEDGIHLTSGAVSQWGTYPPMARQYQIQELTNGLLKVEKPAR